MIFKRFNSSAAGALQKTALYALHVKLGGNMVPYAGYAMPVKYAQQTHIESHNWTRTHAGLFDVSHMLQSTLKGAEATKFLHKITPTDFQNLPAGQGTLSVLLNENGGIVDDTLITKVAENDFSIVTNAGCIDQDVAFLKQQIEGFDCAWEAVQEKGLLALQGPEAKNALGSIVAGGPQSLQDLYFGQRRRYAILDAETTGGTFEVDVARSGYTGEDGFEISVANRDALKLATQLLKDPAVRPIGLAARDSLRLEAGMCLYGHELDQNTTPVEASLNWLISKSRRDGSLGRFNGFDRIMDLINNKSATEARVGFKYVGRGPAARQGAEIFSEDGQKLVGRVTSGSASPSLGGINIGQAYVQKSNRKAGTKLTVRVRNKSFPIEVARLPLTPSHFYKPE
ncbi:LANO_0A03686g1_1 [Lachancea nothofagi CBS 11611]|uniref:Aminomethyltransferase n=1 Tax=Lachancea nothofagi CBS 11611 TaxID=1266666 RepID=A0A1G4IPV5_9SACH|nr:LANO_0A03686g1_1 [Lachancea nothofagi CBS 11611]